MMNISKWIAYFLATIALSSTIPGMASAQVNIQLTPPSVTGYREQTLNFSGTLTNFGSDEVFLNSGGTLLEAQGFVVDLSPFTFGAPLSLLPGESWTGNLFDVAIGSTTEAPRRYDGVFSIEGGATPFVQEPIGSAAFTIQVDVANIAPEPPSLAFAVSIFALVGGCCLLWRQRRLQKSRT